MKRSGIRPISEKRKALLATQQQQRRLIVRKKKMARKPRKPAQTERAHGPAEFRAWMKSRPCIVPTCTAQPCDSAHVHSGGTGRKDNWTRTVPLCSTRVEDGYQGHHDQYDNAKQSFPALHGLDMDTEAELNHANWQSHAPTRTEEQKDV